jgi:hypothetical protein
MRLAFPHALFAYFLFWGRRPEQKTCLQRFRYAVLEKQCGWGLAVFSVQSYCIYLIDFEKWSA